MPTIEHKDGNRLMNPRLIERKASSWINSKGPSAGLLTCDLRDLERTAKFFIERSPPITGAGRRSSNG